MGGYTKKCKQYCRDKFRKIRCFALIVGIMKETELKAKAI